MSDSSAYVPPRVWTWNKPSGGQFASINRPVAGATHEKGLAKGWMQEAAEFLGAFRITAMSSVGPTCCSKGHPYGAGACEPDSR